MNTRTKRLGVAIALLLSLSSLPCPAAEQYKKISRDSIAAIVDGDYDKAIRRSENYLAKDPNDLESLYVLAVAHTQKGQIGKALSCAKEAVDGGFAFSRFQAGPRELLEPLYATDEFRGLAKKHGNMLLHGPMVGNVTDTAASFWVRTADEVPVRVRVTPLGPEATGTRTVSANTEAEKDYTAVIEIDGLTANSPYEYEVSAEGESHNRRGRFRTFPTQGRPAEFTIGFGGGAGYTPPHERMWDTIGSRNLTAFLFLGDNVYIDHPTRPAVQRYCYYRRQSRPEYRRFVANTPIFAIWDDHDFGDDDSWGGPKIDEPAWKIPVWRTFRNNWANPYYGGGRSQPGCWFDFSIADVDFFMLDSRYYRMKNQRHGVDVENPSMLGEAQKKWLLDKLRDAKGTFKVIASQVPWSFGAKPGIGGMDTWEGYKQEREDIFSFIEQHDIEGVLLISADRHRSDVWRIDRPDGYPLYEFESSRLTNIHRHGIMPGAIFGYNDDCSFGTLTFDTTRDDPRVTYRIVNIDNELVYAFVVERSQLTADK